VRRLLLLRHSFPENDVRALGRLGLSYPRLDPSKLEEFRDNLQKEQRRMQAEIDRAVFVTRAQFETEFLAMKEVSQCLAEVKLAFRRLNPLEAGREMTETQRAQNTTRLGEANDKYLAKLEEWGVFLDPTLYDDFEHCHIGADAEFRRPAADRAHERDKSINAEYFWRSYRQACQKVRNSIKSLAVVPGR
jgi:hypothetical protein